MRFSKAIIKLYCNCTLTMNDCPLTSQANNFHKDSFRNNSNTEKHIQQFRDSWLHYFNLDYILALSKSNFEWSFRKKQKYHIYITEFIPLILKQYKIDFIFNKAFIPQHICRTNKGFSIGVSSLYFLDIKMINKYQPLKSWIFLPNFLCKNCLLKGIESCKDTLHIININHCYLGIQFIIIIQRQQIATGKIICSVNFSIIH